MLLGSAKKKTNTLVNVHIFICFHFRWSCCWWCCCCSNEITFIFLINLQDLSDCLPKSRQASQPACLLAALYSCHTLWQGKKLQKKRSKKTIAGHRQQFIKERRIDEVCSWHGYEADITDVGISVAFNSHFFHSIMEGRGLEEIPSTN